MTLLLDQVQVKSSDRKVGQHAVVDTTLLPVLFFPPCLCVVSLGCA